MDIKAALDFLNNELWDENRQGYREAVDRSHVWFIDNFVAWMVMKKFDPAKAKVLEEHFYTYDNQFEVPSGLYGFDRWCILYGDTENFKQSPQWLPDYLRYADLVALQYLYYWHKGQLENAKLMYGYLLNMIRHPSNFPGGNAMFLEDLATRVGYETFTQELYDWLIAMNKPKPEGHTIYKLALLSMCSMKHKRYDIARQCLDMIGRFQVGNPESELYKDGDPVNFPDNPLIEKGGIKTEWWNPDYGPKPPWLQTLANTETTCLCILATTEYKEGTDILPKIVVPALIGTVIGAGTGYYVKRRA